MVMAKARCSGRRLRCSDSQLLGALSTLGPAKGPGCLGGGGPAIAPALTTGSCWGFGVVLRATAHRQGHGSRRCYRAETMSPPILLVLGSPNDPEGRLHSIARGRCELAARLATDNPEAPLLLTGGFGDHFNTTALPHATYLRRYLVELGVAEARFLTDALSKNTIEDAVLSKPIVAAQQANAVVIVTSDYHVARARFLFEREYADLDVGICFVAVPTDEGNCELDLAALKQHETRALKKLRDESETP